MKEKTVKIMSATICLMMSITPFLITVFTTPIPMTNELEEEIIVKKEEPMAHGTRSWVMGNGTMMNETLPTDLMDMTGKQTVGVRFIVHDDCTLYKIGCYNDSYEEVYSLCLWTDSGILLSVVHYPYIPDNSWSWFSIPLVSLYAGNTYIVSIGFKGDFVPAIDNPGPTPDGVLEPDWWVYNPGIGFPNGEELPCKVPLVDISYFYSYWVYGLPTCDIIVPDDFDKIQKAIDAAAEGDTIGVRANSTPYNEELIINKTIRLIGENRDTTFINASGTAIKITSDNVLIEEFNISGGDFGVYCDNTNDTIITRNTIKNNNYGIYCDNTNGTIITESTIKYNNDFGIYLNTTLNDIIRRNKISYNNNDADIEGYGIYALDSYAEGVWGNIISYNIVGAKLIDSWLWGCTNWNTFTRNYIAIYYDPAPLEIDGNRFCGNTIAIKISGDSSPLIVSRNIIVGSEIGILVESGDPHIFQNKIIGNEIGILVELGSPLIEYNLIQDNEYGIIYENDASPIILNNTYVDNVVDIHYDFSAQVDIDPNTLNLKSKGRWITCYIGLPGRFNVSEIDASTVKISEINGNLVDIPAESHPLGIGDEDGDGIPDLMVKFDRSDFQDVCSPGDAEITVSGEFLDGTEFEGYDRIRVIKPP